MPTNRLRPWIALATALFVAGCGSDGMPDPDPEPDPDPGLVDGIQTNQADAALALDAWVQALEARSYDAIVRMLEAPSTTASTDGFQYYVRDDDADRFLGSRRERAGATTTRRA